MAARKTTKKNRKENKVGLFLSQRNIHHLSNGVPISLVRVSKNQL